MNPSNVSFTVSFLMVWCLLSINQSASQLVFPISLNTSVSGTTSADGTPIFSAFTHHDFNEDVGLAEQRVFQFNITHAANPTRIQLSTCIGSSFDTYLVLFSQDPITTLNITALAESGTDLNCDLTFKRAALHTTLNTGTYYVLLTGNSDSYGFFNLTLTSTHAAPRSLPWHLDRVDQRNLPLDHKYQITHSADGIFVYLFDSGVNIDHEEFEGRAELGYDFVRNTDTDALDCTGHGTHTAALIGGRTYGIAKKVRIIAVRVYGCDHTAKTEAIANALNWVLVHSKEIGVQDRCVIALMVPLSKDVTESMGYVINQISRRDIPIVVPAGDDGQNACKTPQEIGSTFITAAAINSADNRATFSNAGPCVDLYAPGVGLESAWHSSTNAVTVMSGTAQAAAIVTGAVALMSALNSEISGSNINNILSSVSTIDVVKKVPANDTGRLVYVRTPPVYNGTIPPPSSVFLLTTLRAELVSCASSPRKIGALQQMLAEAMAVEEQVVETRCTSPSERSNDKRNMSISGKQTGETIIEVQISVGERAATSSFILLERIVVAERLTTEEKFGFSFVVTEMPWAIDSRRVIYWGAPTFPEGQAKRLTAGLVIAIVIIIVLLLCSIGVFFWLCHRRITKKDEILSMEGSADLERGPVHFKDFDDDDSELQTSRSFRNFKKALSFRQTNSIRDSAESGPSGINSLRSFLSRGNLRTGGDVMRLQSFGGEAFANMMQLDRQESSRNAMGLSPGREVSIRGSPRGIGRLNSEWTNDGSAGGQDLMAVRSMGGEAFAGMLESPKN